MEHPWQEAKALGGAIIKEVNRETQLWEKATVQQVTPDTETLVAIEIGCLILLGLGLKNKEDAINLIRGTYNNLTASKARALRNHLMKKLIIKRSPFRQWVKTNALDINNGFEWDSEVTKLGLRLFVQEQDIVQTTNKRTYKNLPPEFKDLANYPAQVIAEFADYILAMPITTKNRASQINVFRTDLTTMLKDGCFDNDPNLHDKLQQKLEKLSSLI